MNGEGTQNKQEDNNNFFDDEVQVLEPDVSAVIDLTTNNTCQRDEQV